MKRFLLFLAAAAVAAGLWLLLGRRPDVTADEAKPVAQVQVVPLRSRPIVESLPAFGIVEPAPSGSRTVALAYDAVVTRVAVSQGATVAKGDVIMELEPTPDAKLAMASARSAGRLAEQALASAKQRFELRLATNQDLLAAEQASQDAAARLASLEGRGQSGDGRLVAPEAGVVTRLDVQPGTVVAAGNALVAIAGRGRLEAHLAVEPADAARVQAGQGILITAADRPASPGAGGTVREVGASVDPVSGAVDVRATLPAGEPWFAGEHLQGAIHVGAKTALVAPRPAILPEGDHQVLYTVKEGRAVKHVVRVGIVDGQDVEVIGRDLAAGDSAVIVGNYELEDGMAAEVQAGEAKTGPEKKQ